MEQVTCTVPLVRERDERGGNGEGAFLEFRCRFYRRTLSEHRGIGCHLNDCAEPRITNRWGERIDRAYGIGWGPKWEIYEYCSKEVRCVYVDIVSVRGQHAISFWGLLRAAATVYSIFFGDVLSACAISICWTGYRETPHQNTAVSITYCWHVGCCREYTALALYLWQRISRAAY